MRVRPPFISGMTDQETTMSKNVTPGLRIGLALGLAICATLLGTGARAQSILLNQTHTIAAADQGVPVEHPLHVASDGKYQVTLADLGNVVSGAPLSSVKLAITSATAVVGSPLAGPGTATFSLTAGDYVMRVIGAPGPNAGSGPFSVQTINTANSTTIDSFSGTLALPVATPTNQFVLDQTFTVQTSGSYQVTLADLGLPQALSQLTLLLSQQGQTALLTLTQAGSQQVTLNTGVTYHVLAAGLAAGNAGLFSVTVAPAGGGSPVLAQTCPIGSVAQIGTASLGAGSFTLKLADLQFPAPLTQVAVAVAQNGAVLTSLNATGNGAPFTVASAGSYQVFATATPGSSSAATSGTGSYAVQILPAGGGAAAFSVAQAVSTSGAALTGYTFNTTLTSAGTYNAQLADFQFPTPLSNVSFAVVQGTSLLGTPLTTSGTQSVTAAAGPLSMLAFAKSTTGGLFGVDLVPGAGGDPVFQATQGVGGLFSVQKVTVPGAARYQVAVTDLGFPATFAQLAVLVTRGTSTVVSIIGAQSFNIDATSGDYYVSLLAQPGGTDKAGTYNMTVGPAPAAPTVTLQSSATTVTAGGTVTLTWSAQNATSCAGSGGGWNATSLSPSGGSQTSPAISANTTFTVTCNGSGGTGSSSVTVSLGTATSGGGGHGGGGALGWEVLAALFGLLARRSVRARHV